VFNIRRLKPVGRTKAILVTVILDVASVTIAMLIMIFLNYVLGMSIYERKTWIVYFIIGIPVSIGMVLLKYKIVKRFTA
jgi:hypothetical protein